MIFDLEIKYLNLAGVKIKNISNETVNCKCPVCGEGKSKWKHRGYVLKKPGEDTASFFCQNECGAMSFVNMLNSVNPSLGSAYLVEAKKQKVKNFKKNDLEMFDLEPTKIVEKPIPNKIVINSEVYDLDELNDRSKEYLLNQRKLPLNALKHFRYIVELDAIVALFLTSENSFYGYQLRSLKEKSFHIHLFDNNPKIWNIYGVDPSKPIYVFESIFCALSSGLDNVISTLGASVSKQLLDELFPGADIVFCLDNDIEGKNKAIKYSNLGYKVLVHDSKFPAKDYNEALVAGAKPDQIAKYILDHVCGPKMANFKLRLRG